MGMPNTSDLTPAVFAHHVRAIMAHQAQADREAIGAHVTRGGFRDQNAKETTSRKTPVSGRVVDWFAASPLTGRDRQSGGFRVPHVDFTPITPVIAPISKDGRRRAHITTALTAAQHVDYVTDGAKIGIGSHIDYIGRVTGIADPLGGLAMDALDELAERNEKNALGRYTNIPGGWAGARSLFEAAEHDVPAPTTYELLASTADWKTFAYMRRLASTPDWLRRMEERLRPAYEALADEATKSGKPIRHRQVVVHSGTSAEAYDRLAWLDHHPALSGRVDWKQGRTRRCQYRFVGELPDGLSARERHAILTDFCDLLGQDGWMVVGAIHQPDATNDRRNFHIHIDLFDRKAEWLEDANCWDFEYVVHKNGKDTRPLRHNKVRYGTLRDDGKQAKFDVAGFMRSRFIDTVKAVVGDRTDVVRYLHGTYKDNDIALTPLNHMGNRAIGLEKRGIVTEVGSINARRIAADEAAACEKRASEAGAALAGELALVRAILAHDRAALKAADQYERLQRRLIRRRLQAELAEVVIAMSRSRADAVIRTLTPAPGHRIKFRTGNAELLADAQRHIAWVERNSPSPAEREAERHILARLEHRAAGEWAIIEAASSRAGDVGTSAPIRYQPRDRAMVTAPPRASRYDDQRRQRLSLWLHKHRSDAGRLIFADGIVRLGASVPPAIDTLMRRFAEEPPFQRLLRSERQRRETGVTQRGALPDVGLGGSVSWPVEMIPADQWQRPVRAKPDETARGPATISDGKDQSPTAAAVTKADDAAALRLSTAIAALEQEKAHRAALKIAESLARKASTARKRNDAAMRADDTIRDGADPTERTSHLPNASPGSTLSDHGPTDHDRHSKEEHRGAGRQIRDKVVPRRYTGLRPLAGLAGLRVLRGIGVDDRSADAAGLLPDVRRTDVRRASAVHLEVRGAPADRLTAALDLSGATAPLTAQHEPGHSDPLLRRGLWAQAEDAVRSDEHRLAKSKGGGDGVDEVARVTSRDERGR